MGEWSGNLSLTLDVFSQKTTDQRQMNDNLSLSMQPRWLSEWDDGYQNLTIEPFARLDRHNSALTHWDIRELSWFKSVDNWEMQLGVSSVFWGVTESAHLVDVINQRDYLEDFDGTSKLGQPMLRMSWITDWGTPSVFVLFGFREQEFASTKNRYRLPFPVQSAYYSTAENRHIDLALRWENSIDEVDLGISYFYGTSREANLQLNLQTPAPYFVAYYDQIQQLALDAQWTHDAWLWKLETLYRKTQSTENHMAAVAGFEYTYYGIMESDTDLGILMEYQYDNRKIVSTPANNDVFLGFRLSMNDAQSSEFLAGGVIDRDSDAKMFYMRGSRRIGESYKLSVEGRWFTVIPTNDPLFAFARDDFVRLELAWYF